ncbi:MAG: DedA family protein [Lentimicrobiaceae bacterium]|jgi:membrane-associated protein|nr:DedA family protein [Lentimicrobiaceae bacterium]
MLELFNQLIYILTHIDIVLRNWVVDYQTWTYLILFTIIFCETGLVVTPFLPGDSLLFAAGAVAAMPGNPLNIIYIVVILVIAAFAGDNSNYWIGRFLGDKVYKKDYRLIKRKYLDQTHTFYEKHGVITIIIARFMPIIRTFAPFVAGVGKMKYPRFYTFSFIGNIIWVSLFSIAGYLFGNLPSVKSNFSIVIFAIIGISLLPPVFTALRHRFQK